MQLPDPVIVLALQYYAARAAADVFTETRRAKAKELARAQDQESVAVAERDRLRAELLKALDQAAEALAGERAA